MTQYLKSLYLCICLLGGFISCQTNESITQDEEIQTIMEGISNQAGQEKNPYLTAGDKTYIIGTQDGNFPDLGRSWEACDQAIRWLLGKNDR